MTKPRDVLDETARLRAVHQDAIRVDVNSTVLRVSDGAVAGVRLPPTKNDAPAYADHARSLAGEPQNWKAVAADF